MAGWFFNPPPPVQPQVHAPVAAAWSNVAPNPIGSGAQFDAIRSTWLPESWPAQSGDIVAGGLATALASPQPQPFYGTRPLDALIRSLWPSESWTSQVLIGGGIGAITGTVAPPLFAPAGAIAKAVATAINATWPPDAWGAQVAGKTASWLAAVTTPVIFPSPLRALGPAVASTWLPESWYAQSECAIASGIAQIQVPPLYLPWSTTARTALLRSFWLPEDWPAQAGARYAAWITPFVTPLPAVIRHPEILLWSADTWGAQSGTRSASISAQVPPPLPYQNRGFAAALRAAWLSEDWRTQTAPPFAGVFVPPVVIPAMSSSVLRAVRLWLPEDWPSQSGARYAGWIPPFVTPLPTVIRHPEILLWAADTWSAQAGTRAASILAGRLPSLPYLNRWLSTVVRSAWLPENWSAQTFPDFAGGQSPLTPPLPRSPSQFTISLWPVELWGTQSGTRAASILAIPQIITFMPNVVGEPQIVAVAQLQSLFGALITLQYVYSGAPAGIVVAQSIAPGTEVGAGTPVTLQVSLGRHHGPVPCPIVESILVSNIPVVLSILPPNKTVIH
jgi:hypothetical protein